VKGSISAECVALKMLSPVQVASSFLSGLQNAAQSCINGLTSINGAPSSTVMSNQYNKCCPVIKAVSDFPNLCGEHVSSMSLK